MRDLKQKYNKVLIRMNQASAFMDGEASAKEKDRWLPEFKKIEKNLDSIIGEMSQAGYDMRPEEIINGFNA
jgi:hypothetical protein